MSSDTQEFNGKRLDDNERKLYDCLMKRYKYNIGLYNKKPNLKPFGDVVKNKFAQIARTIEKNHNIFGLRMVNYEFKTHQYNSIDFGYSFEYFILEKAEFVYADHHGNKNKIVLVNKKQEDIFSQLQRELYTKVLTDFNSSAVLASFMLNQQVLMYGYFVHQYDALKLLIKMVANAPEKMYDNYAQLTNLIQHVIVTAWEKDTEIYNNPPPNPEVFISISFDPNDQCNIFLSSLSFNEGQVVRNFAKMYDNEGNYYYDTIHSIGDVNPEVIVFVQSMVHQISQLFNKELNNVSVVH